ncbi:hypothetical protein ACFOD1_02605 [Pseudidiomarina halophila]|uniref:Uncharacterized protein n=1 Tax=Pseudidiomarina halophila TaxID=1449799 RepID=A0A432XWT0_9GAMM|nr:hypothetical protein [Pseudidiomarina halophila]RUO53159.1 hypothetical protein CWI69_09060 [Pseudidiomarina halophila]
MRTQLLYTATLCAAALLCAPAHTADLSQTSSLKTSHEYLSLVSSVDSQPLRVNLSDNYVVGDFLIFEFPGNGIVDTESLPNTVWVDPKEEYDLPTVNFAFNSDTEIEHPCNTAVAEYPQYTHWHYESQTTYPWLTTDELCRGYISESEHLLRVMTAPDLLLAHGGITFDAIGTGYDTVQDLTWAKYRVTAISGEVHLSTVGAEADFGSVTFNASALSEFGPAFSVRTLSRTGYDNYPDSTSGQTDRIDEHEHDSAVLFELDHQWQLLAGEVLFQRTVDVGEPYRRLFVPASGWAQADVDEGFYQLGSGAFDLAAQPLRVVYQLTGPQRFSWIIDYDHADAIQDYSTQISFSDSKCGLLSLSENELTFECVTEMTDGSDLLSAASIRLTLNGQEIVEHGEFKLNADVVYGLSNPASTEGTTTLAAIPFGEWGLNAAVMNVAAMPFAAQTATQQQATGIDQIL